ncbi:hypothetical protein AM499_09060 [Bacillus sp. FJAT-22090]|uniref:DUF1850 domain-containing protein n=1 Tax=Bacillus sp. FJAT-22090 TaxID=1581038 RepID=UPI0006AF748D|nr:DUF1850 domain-containing protein [Bacillus sp. FJAT-22090]ALC85959.1 hypothetical protein AM499_09060 [Bacillus sp. FJAT-22090]
MKRIIATFLIIILISLLFIPMWTVFVFTETRNENSVLHYIPISEEKDFQIIFTHSIHLTDVIESYRVEDTNKIRLMSMKYSDVAIGMPSYPEEGQKLNYQDGIYTLQYDDAVLQNFTLYIGDVDYPLSFKYKNKIFDLKTNLVRGKSYLFEVKKISLVEKMKGVRLNGR